MVGKVMPSVEESYQVLRETLKILERLAIACLIDGGTLLGFYRDGTFAVDDHDDIDLTLWGKDSQRISEIIEAMNEAGFELFMSWPRDEARHRTAQLAFKKNNVKVDMMFKEIKKYMAWWTVYGGSKKITYKAVPSRFYLFRQNIRTGSDLDNLIDLVIPFEIKKYLEYRYGNWTEPVHRSKYSCYTSDKAILKNNSYDGI